MSGLKQFFSLDRRFVARLLLPLLFSALHIFLSLLFSGSAGMMALLTLLPWTNGFFLDWLRRGEGESEGVGWGF